MKSYFKSQNFQKLKILGQGTYGKCYLVNNVKQNQLYVLKQIQIGGMNQEEIQETMKQARILQALDHPNIIKCIGAFVEDKTLHILMDYADGGDLSKKIKNARGSYFSQHQILNWFTQICLAIKHVHDRKIIHRDLKSQNIFLTSQNLVKLGDFGIAKSLQMTLQKIKTVVGTPYYMSPQICENKQYSLKTDIWSLGVILFQMCALKPPFDANSLPALALKITRGQFGMVPNHYSKQLKKLIADLLQVQPAKRPNINELLKYAFIKSRIDLLLPQGIRDRQFSHTTLHFQNIFERDDLKKQISKLAHESSQLNSFISPRNQQNNVQFFPISTPQNKANYPVTDKAKDSNWSNKQKSGFDKKKKSDVKRRQISQPSLTPRSNEKKLKSNISLTNLQKKKSDRDKKPYFKKKKMNQDIKQIKQIRGQIVELKQQLSYRDQEKKQIPNIQRSVFHNNFIKEEDEENSFSQSSSSFDEEHQMELNSDEKQNASVRALTQTLENILTQMIGQKQLSKRYTQIQQNNGFVIQKQKQSAQGQGLISLLYGVNTLKLTSEI